MYTCTPPVHAYRHSFQVIPVPYIPLSDQWIHTLPYSWCCLWRSTEADIFGNVHNDITSDQ